MRRLQAIEANDRLNEHLPGTERHAEERRLIVTLVDVADRFGYDNVARVAEALLQLHREHCIRESLRL